MLTPILGMSQELKKPIQSYDVKAGADIVLNASFIEIEIEEWDKNKVQIEPIMYAEGISKKEIQKDLDDWDIDVEKVNNQVVINSNSDLISSEYFFMGSDKIIGEFELPEIIEIPEINMDSVIMVMPKFENFPEMAMNFDADSLHFDFEKYKDDESYMIEWQKSMQENMKKMNEQLQESLKVLQSEEMKIQLKNAQEMAEIHREKAEKHRELFEKNRSKHEAKIQSILEEREKRKSKKLIKLKIPKNANLKLNVDYCKVSMSK